MSLPPVPRSRCSRTRMARRPRPRVRLVLEWLEGRNLPSTFGPSQLVHAYGFDQVPFVAGGYNATAGLGQTIAIVDAYDNPNIAADLQIFDTQYGLPAPPSFLKVNQSGSAAGPFPAADTNWALEMALDVEWAHAIAPAANILLVEANSQTDTDLLAAVDTASQSGAAAVSMSWGFNEFAAQTDAAHDGHFTGHPGVTFVAASGDSGRPPIWPATSPNVLAVGGTNLKLTTANAWSSEKGWGTGSWSFFFGGSGGGISKYEPKPTYQSGVTQSSTKRTSPDVAYDADPATGVAVYDSTNGGWLTVGGTSAGAPQWAALIAIADQGRALALAPALSSSDTLGAIYTMAGTNFHDITSGNNGYAATTGYDLVTGRGTPKANLVINSLVNFASSKTLAGASQTGGGTRGDTAKGQVISNGTSPAPVVVTVLPAVPVPSLLFTASTPRPADVGTVLVTGSPGVTHFAGPATPPVAPASAAEEFRATGQVVGGTGAAVDDDDDPDDTTDMPAGTTTPAPMPPGVIDDPTAALPAADLGLAPIAVGHGPTALPDAGGAPAALEVSGDTPTAAAAAAALAVVLIGSEGRRTAAPEPRRRWRLRSWRP
jgi:hypothetical protein